MVDVQPLRGIRYVRGTVGNLADVVSPPYDVISKEDQARYYERSPYNIIRLELGYEWPDDTSLNNRYTRAAATFAQWRKQDVLRQETTPCFYLYQQIFRYGGQSYTRTSLLARVRLEPWSTHDILPHEHTMTKPKNDRLNLLQACAANFSPIMSMYDDPQGRIRRLLAAYAARPEVQITDEVGEEHRLQPVSDPDQLALIQNFFAERQLYIADGHHRYETALTYREQIREQRRELHHNDAVNFVLMALMDLDDPGLLVLPTHRLLFGLSNEALSALTEERLSQFFTLREMETGVTSEAILQQLAHVGEEQPSLVLSAAAAEPGAAPRTRMLSLNEKGKQQMMESGHSEAWNELDVAVAHTLLLEALLRISADEVTAGTSIRYTRDAQQALQAVATGEVQVALLLNPTRVRQICAVAQADDRMPQKSTYFYPKLITGMVFNPLW